MLKLIKVVYRIIYTIFKLKMKIKFNCDDCKYIIWAPHFYTLRFLHGDNFPKTVSMYKALKQYNKKVCIYTKKDIGKFHNKTIFIVGSPMYNSHGFDDYVDILFYIVEQLENQNNMLYPNLKQIKYWENKIYMHEMFDKLDIKTPKSIIVDCMYNIEKLGLEFPFLLKEPHSCSANGVHKISSQQELLSISKKLKFSDKIIVQELLNIKRDLRVIIVGNEIVLHYWRINLSDEWKPTSTGFGSDVDFISFPEKWKTHMLHTLKKLELDTGAFDIAWQNDDITTEPYYLEVSPYYQPNPIPDFDLNKISYGEWKKSFTLTNNYNKKMIDILFDIQSKYIGEVVK